MTPSPLGPREALNQELILLKNSGNIVIDSREGVENITTSTGLHRIVSDLLLDPHFTPKAILELIEANEGLLSEKCLKLAQAIVLEDLKEKL